MGGRILCILCRMNMSLCNAESSAVYCQDYIDHLFGTIIIIHMILHSNNNVFAVSKILVQGECVLCHNAATEHCINFLSSFFLICKIAQKNTANQHIVSCYTVVLPMCGRGAKRVRTCKLGSQKIITNLWFRRNYCQKTR